MHISVMCYEVGWRGASWEDAGGSWKVGLGRDPDFLLNNSIEWWGLELIRFQ